MANRLEVMLAKIGRDLRDRQIATFWKVPESMQQTPCDFFGFTAAGRAILIEAKMVNRPSLPIGDDPGLAPHQWAALEDADRANALAFVSWARLGMVKTIDFAMAKRLAAGRKSIPWAAIPESYCRMLHSMDILDHYLCDSSTSGLAIS